MGTQIRRVVFIGSCSYSGSTVLDMMLGRSEGNLSMGEIGRIFLPRSKEHFNRECGCLEKDCDFWSPLLQHGPVELHKRAFEEYGVSTLIDSTKDPHWIKDRTLELRKCGIDVVNLLIWKDPSSIRESFVKRGIEKKWKNSWVNYHRLYFSLVDEFHSLPFSALLEGGVSFSSRINAIGIKKINFEFWDYPGHTLFGNDSAKRHLHPVGTEEYKVIQARREESVSKEHDAFSHRQINHSEKSELIITNPLVEKIYQYLKDNDIANSSKGKTSLPPPELKMSRLSASIRRLHSISKTYMSYFKWGKKGK